MHELSIAQNIFDIVRGQVDEGRIVGKIMGIHLRVGKMSSVVPDNLRFMFEVVSKETFLQDVRLDIEHIPVAGKCQHCLSEFPIEVPGVDCPHCGSSEVAIVRGRELEIESVEVE